MGVNTDMLGSYDLTGNDYTSYDFDAPAWDLGDYSVDYSDSVTDFDLGSYFDFEDTSWDTSIDKVFASASDDLYGADEGEEYFGKLYGDEPETSKVFETEDDKGVNLDAGKEGEKKPLDDPFGLDEDIKKISGDERMSGGEKARQTLYGDDVRSRFEQGEEVTINGKTYVYNPITGKAEVKGSGGFMDFLASEKGLGLLGGLAKGGLGFLAKNSEAEMMQKMWEDKVKLAREDRQHDMDMYNLKMSYKSGGGGARPDANAAHNSALANMTQNSRRGDFSKR